MKKFSVFLAAVCFCGSVLLSGCGKEVKVSGTLDSTGAPITVVTTKKPSELDAYNVAYAFVQKQKDWTTYESVTTGETVAKTIISYTQKIEDKTIKHGDEYFQEAKSSSAFVKVSHQVFVKGDKVAYRNALSGDLHTASKADYKAEYGALPDDVALGGFILNNETLKFAEKTETQGDTFTYHYTIDGEKGGADMKKRMKKYADLNDYPSFTSVEIGLTVKDDWTPVSLTVEADYRIDIAILGKINCKQKIATVYSNVNGNVEIPDTKAFNAAIGSEPTTIVTDKTEKPAFAEIAEAFAGYDWNTGMHFGLDLSVGLFEESGLFAGAIPSEIYIKYNEESVKNGRYLDAINFRMDIDLHNTHPVFSLVGMMSSMMPVDTLPFDVSLLASVYSASVYYIGDGYLYLTVDKGIDEYDDDWNSVFVDVGQAMIVKKIDVISSLLPVLNDFEFANGMDTEAMTEFFESAFTLTETETEKTFTLIPELTAILADSYNALIDSLVDIVKVSAGDLGELAGGMIRGWLGADISSLSFRIVDAEGGLSEMIFEITGVSQQKKSEDENTLPYSLLRIGLTVDGKLNGELAGDQEQLTALLADDAVAAPVREAIELLEKNMWLEDSFVERLNKVRAEYENLTDGQKALVTNAAKLTEGTLEAKRDELKAKADAFLKNFDADGNWKLSVADGETLEAAWERVNGLFDDTQSWLGVEAGIGSTAVQREYIGEARIVRYLEARAAYEAEM